MKRRFTVLLFAFVACSAVTVLSVGGWLWVRYAKPMPAQRDNVKINPTKPLVPAGSPSERPAIPSAQPLLPGTVTSNTEITGTPQTGSLQQTGDTASLAPTPTPLSELPTLEKIRATYPLPVRDLFSLAQRLGRVGGGARRVLNPDPPEYEVGDSATFWISEEAGKSYFEITATLRYVGEHAAWWVQDGVKYDERGLIAAAKQFDEQTYPTNRQYFGEEWFPGVDNDPRIHVVNGRLSEGIGGYYSSSDEYPDAINPHSNQREVIYINLGAYTPGDERYNAVIAHEFQHMIHWHNDANESTWVDEGLSELAVYLNGYGRDRWASVFAREPDTQLNAWSDNPGAAGVHYGASYLFMRYFADRFGPERVRALVASDESDIVGFDTVLSQEGLTFDDVFRDWVVANYLDDTSIADGRYGYQDVNISVHVAKRMQAGESWGDVVQQYGTDYLELRPVAGPLVVRFKGADTVPVLAAKPHSGKYFFWSNRGDGSVTSMTRAFDLTQTQRATLEAWLWYDIEEFFDFAYVEVSTDGGVTWQILAGQHSITENPTGNGLGPGYSGRSRVDGKPDWVKESIDLTPFAGQKILLRWEQITDDGYNAPGLAIDDIAIPEVGYFEDFESGDGGWKADGFVRIDNVLPQRWALQLIELGDTPHVRQIPVYDGRATLKVDKRAVLAISAMTPFTTEAASYTIAVD
ncbi:MAG: hypothetical protein D6791_03435 [Chloroflexi bacterium]|nr:MAG: hypothetical protein D6791_03435 [Chloroflexota bacterium]